MLHITRHTVHFFSNGRNKLPQDAGTIHYMKLKITGYMMNTIYDIARRTIHHVHPNRHSTLYVIKHVLYLMRWLMYHHAICQVYNMISYVCDCAMRNRRDWAQNFTFQLS